jgi:ABC-type dipeptide/oligopeptide/nickel transport system permease component
MAATAVSAALVIIGNLLAEALATWADPRLRTDQPLAGQG